MSAAYECHSVLSESNDALDVASNDTITENSDNEDQNCSPPEQHNGFQEAHCTEKQLQQSNPKLGSHNINYYKHPKFIVKWNEKDVSGISYSRIKFNR